MPITILIVEDEPAICGMLQDVLKRHGYSVLEAADVTMARHIMADCTPDLILLDWMLPDVSGVEFARQLKKNDTTAVIPIIMLTARGEESDKVRGLESGADDYITKPFSPKELIARIKAVLRRTSPKLSEEVIDIEGLCLDSGSHRVTANEQTVEMGPTEFRMLHFFMTHQDRVYSRIQLLDRVWGGNVYIEERTIDVHIRRLRKVLTPSGHDYMIQTIRGAGYRFSVNPK